MGRQFNPIDGKILVAGDLTDLAGHNDIALARYNSDGTLDSSFGNGGLVRQYFGADELVAGVALQPDSKIVIVGKQVPADGEADILIARFMPDGEVDTSFGQRKGRHGLGSLDSAWAVAIQKDHKIVVVGSTWPPSFQPVRGVLARYNENGSLDGIFDHGRASLSLFSFLWQGQDRLRGREHRLPVSVALRKSDGTEDGKIVVAGQFGVARFNDNGTLDQDFGNAGIMDQPDNSGNAVAILATNDIVVAGANADNFAVALYGSTGQHCSGEEPVTTDFVRPWSGANAMAIDSGGKIFSLGVLITATTQILRSHATRVASARS